MNNVIKIAKPHDSLIKAALTDLTIARDFLNQHLTPIIREQLDLATLKLVPGHLINKELRLSETDILFTVDCKKASRPAYVICHLEQQATSPRDMALRIMQYKMRILEQERKINKDGDLPVIISTVIYNGKVPYTAPTDFYELFGEQKELAKREMFNGYQLIDLSQIPDDELATHKKASLVEWVLKHVHDQNFMTLQETLAAFLRGYFNAIATIATPQDEDHIVSITYYLLSEANIAIEQQAAFFDIIKENLPSAVGEKIMSLAQYIEQQGINKGILQGMQQGMQTGRLEGILEGQHKLLSELLESKFGAIAHRYSSLAKDGNSDQLIAWTRKAAVVQNIDEVFKEI